MLQKLQIVALASIYFTPGMHAWHAAVVDWNPSGAAILAVYKYGSQRMHEAAQYALPTLRWLGARGALLHGVPNLALQVRLSCVHVAHCTS